MRVKVNLRHLETKNVRLSGELTPEELDLAQGDEMAQANETLSYDFEVERKNNTLLLNGKLETTLDCECVRCLTPFKLAIAVDPFEAVVPLEGEEAAPVDNDLVDLTPYIREDILLAFPRHPLCKAECDRLPDSPVSGEKSLPVDKTAWDELNKLKF